jgi:hypothetical protein
LIAIICEELPEGEPAEYSADDLGRFTTNGSWSIARARDNWRGMFGWEERGVSVADAWRHIIQSQSRPVQ